MPDQTQLRVSGGRRSAAPRYAPTTAEGTAAISGADELLRRLLGVFAAAGGAGANAGGVAGADSVGGFDTGNFLSGLSQGSGIAGGDYVGNFGFGDATGNFGVGDLSGLGDIGRALGALGVLGENADLGRLGSILGLGSSLLGNQTTTEQKLGTIASVLAQRAGVPGGALGLITSALQGNQAGMVNSGLALASPQAAAANMLLSLTTGTFGDMPVSLGDIVTQSGFGTDVFGDVGPIDATQGAMTLNAANAGDRLGALMALSGGENTQLPTAAATTAGNALAVAENIDPLDALMQITTAYGTASSMQGAQQLVQGEVDRQAAEAARIAMEQEAARVAAEQAAAAEAAAQQAAMEQAAAQQALQTQQAAATGQPTYVAPDYSLPVFDYNIFPQAPALPDYGVAPSAPAFSGDYYNPTIDYSIPSAPLPNVSPIYNEADWNYLSQQTSNIFNDLRSAEAALGIQVPSYTPSTPVFSGDYYSPAVDYSIGAGATSGTGLSAPSWETTYTAPTYTAPSYSWEAPSYSWSAPSFDYSWSAPSFDFGFSW